MITELHRLDMTLDGVEALSDDKAKPTARMVKVTIDAQRQAGPVHMTSEPPTPTPPHPRRARPLYTSLDSGFLTSILWLI